MDKSIYNRIINGITANIFVNIPKIIVKITVPVNKITLYTLSPSNLRFLIFSENIRRFDIIKRDIDITKKDNIIKLNFSFKIFQKGKKNMPTQKSAFAGVASPLK